MADKIETRKDKIEKKTGRVMPNNVEAERYVIGAAMIDDKAAGDLIPALKVEDFYLYGHRTIFEAMRDLISQSKPVDMVSVADKLELVGKLDDVGGVDYLSELTESIPSAANCKYYADIVRRDSLTRKVISAGNEILEFSYQCTSGADALGKAEQLVYSIAEQVSDKQLEHAGTALSEAMQNIQATQTGNIVRNAVYTGFPQFDAKTKGMKPGEYIILAARPAVGKTALALNFAANIALRGKTVAVFSLEMQSELLVKRMLAYVSGVTFNDMDTRGNLSSEDTGKLYQAFNALNGAPLYLDDYSLNSPSDVLSKCRRLKRDHGLDLVIVDYIGLMKPETNRSSDSRQNEVSDMSRKLKVYAKDLGVPILALSQMSRGVEKEKDREPQLSDLRDSGAIEQDADVVAFLHDPSKSNPNTPEGLIKMIIRKNRNGPIGEIKLQWQGDTTSFKEIAEKEEIINIPLQAKVKETSSGPEEESNYIEVDKGALPFGEVASDAIGNEDKAPFEEDKEFADDLDDDGDLKI